MKVLKKIRGTMESVPSIEVNKDTVYIRSNIERVEEEDFKGWEYDEIQYDKDIYIEQINSLGQVVAEKEIEVLLLGQQVSELELTMMLGGDVNEK